MRCNVSEKKDARGGRFEHDCPPIVCAGMPPKNSCKGIGKGKALRKRPARVARPLACFLEEGSETSVEDEI